MPVRIPFPPMPALRLHLASGNRNKLREHRELATLVLGKAGRAPVEIVSAADVGGMPRVPEDTGSFAGNARQKAAALKARLPADAWVLADDSGLCVDALDGAPGVDSAVYAGPQADGAANLAKLVEALRAVPEDRRSAHFICVLVVLGAGGVELTFSGRCDGRLLREPRGAAGFGYDPLFVPQGHAASFAELGDGVKNAISHRTLAWNQLAGWLARRELG